MKARLLKAKLAIAAASVGVTTLVFGYLYENSPVPASANSAASAAATTGSTATAAASTVAPTPAAVARKARKSRAS